MMVHKFKMNNNEIEILDGVMQGWAQAMIAIQVPIDATKMAVKLNSFNGKSRRHHNARQY